MYRSNAYQEDLVQLTSSLSKLLKQRFGKGPEKCFVTYYGNRLTISVRNFMTPAEEVLVEHDQTELALYFRSAVMGRVFIEIAQEASNVLGASFDSYYDDWDYASNSGIMMLENKHKQDRPVESDGQLSSMLFQHIRKLNDQEYKTPERMELLRCNPNIYLVKCQGVLLQIEKQLYKKGHMDLLQSRSLDIKRKFRLERRGFAHIFGRNVEDLFMTWDYVHDQCYIFFCLE